MTTHTLTDRFAPSPTGLLHLGHAFSAMLGHDTTRMEGGRFLLRMEDLDTSRVRAPFYAAIEQDLAWLGVRWDGPVIRQSAREAAYAGELDRLGRAGLLYRCVCTRAEIRAAVSAPQEGVEGDPPYPGTCRGRDVGPGPAALRLDLRRALASAGSGPLCWEEIEGGRRRMTLDPDHLVATAGDVVLRRKDGAAAYHLAVVVDDAWQAVTRVTRGEDLRDATPIHRLLQALLGLPVPEYRHHRLIRDDTGRRLAKRDDARAIATLREEGATPGDVRQMVGLT